LGINNIILIDFTHFNFNVLLKHNVLAINIKTSSRIETLLDSHTFENWKVHLKTNSYFQLNGPLITKIDITIILQSYTTISNISSHKASTQGRNASGLYTLMTTEAEQ